MALFLLEDRDFKGFWMKIWNAGVSVITRSTFSSFNYILYDFRPNYCCFLMYLMGHAANKSSNISALHCKINHQYELYYSYIFFFCVFLVNNLSMTQS